MIYSTTIEKNLISMNALHHYIHLKTKQNVQLLDITDQVQQLIADGHIINGIVSISSQHTTVAVTVNENEARLLDDIATFFEKLAPENSHYLHNDIHLRDCPPDEPENAHAHLIAMCMGNSESFSVVEGKLVLGTYQSIMAIELDGPRERKLSVQLLGSA